MAVGVYASLLAFNVPSSVRADPVATTILVKNTGYAYGEVYVDLWDAQTGARLWGSTRLGLPRGGEVTFYTSGSNAPVMPNRALELIVQTHHDGEIDDMQQKRIPLYVPELVASFNASPKTGTVPLPVTFSISISGGVPSYSWVLDFKDGTSSATGAEASKTLMHTYSKTGKFVATLTVTDALGASMLTELGIGIGLPTLAWWQWGLIGLAALSGIGVVYTLAKNQDTDLNKSKPIFT